MSNEDLQFHYFKVHDSDNDDKLDGIELATAMAHYHDEEAAEKPEDYTEEVRTTCFIFFHSPARIIIGVKYKIFNSSFNIHTRK